MTLEDACDLADVIAAFVVRLPKKRYNELMAAADAFMAEDKKRRASEAASASARKDAADPLGP